jgi:hypothetical protein
VAPDDPTSVRELRFRHGPNHIIVTAAPDGTGEVRVLDDFFVAVQKDAKRAALKATLKILSVARRWVFEDFLKEGGRLEDLADIEP